MRKTARAALLASGLAAAALALPDAALAGFPGAVDPLLIGDWQCGTARVYITKLGSIEVIDGGYRAGLIDAGGGTLAIQWDDGSRVDWSYAAGDGGPVLSGLFDGPSPCGPR